jgi:predicted RNA-binding protein with PUA-like domain
MRTIPTEEQRLVEKLRREVHVRVTLSNNRGGTAWDIELTNYGARNWVRGVEFGDDVEQAVGQATIRLARESWWTTLAPYVSTSRLNKVNGGDVQVLKPVRLVKIETQLAPEGASADSAGSWTNVFEGYISTLEFGGDNEITLTCRDRGAFLQDCFIEKEATQSGWYSGVTWTPSVAPTLEGFMQNLIDGAVMNSLAARANSTAYSLGDIRRPATRNGYAYKCTTAGTCGGSPPTFPTVIGATVTDGTAVWTCYSELPELYIPTGSGIVLTEQPASNPIFRREPLLGALQRLAALRGWCCRYRWDDGTSAWRLTLFDPRADTDVDATWDEDFYEVRSARIDLAGVRNVVQVVYPDGSPQTRTEATPSEDATSIADYGRRWCELAEASVSQISSASEATDFADIVLADISKPYADIEVQVPFYPYLVAGDVVQLNGGHRLWTSDLTAVVVGITHALGDARWTTVRCRELGAAPPIFGRMWGKIETRFSYNLIPPALRPLLPNSFESSPSSCEVQATLALGQTMARNAEDQVDLDTVTLDRGGDFDTASGKFTAPVNGLYVVSAALKLESVSSGVTVRVMIKKGTTSGDVEVAASQITTIKGPSDVGVSCSATVGLSAGDELTMWTYYNDSANRDATAGSTCMNVRRAF